VLSGSVLLASLLSSSRDESDFLPDEPFLAAAAAAAAARSCLRNLARRFWNHTWPKRGEVTKQRERRKQQRKTAVRVA
jgi:hypothetical protein